MFYRFAVTVPKNTPKESPVEQMVRLTAGVVEKVEITFPSGCAGLVGLRILRGGHVVWPTSPGEWFVSDDYTISFPERYPILDEPLELRLQAYNLDDTYNHTPVVRLAVKTEEPDWLSFIAYKLDELANKPPPISHSEVGKILEAIGTIDGNLYGLRQADIQMLADYLHAILQRLEQLTEGVKTSG